MPNTNSPIELRITVSDGPEVVIRIPRDEWQNLPFEQFSTRFLFPAIERLRAITEEGGDA